MEEESEGIRVRKRLRKWGGERESKARGKVQEPLDNKAKVSVKYLWNWVSVCTLCSFGQKKREKKREKQGRPNGRKNEETACPKTLLPITTFKKKINDQLQTKYQLPYL